MANYSKDFDDYLNHAPACLDEFLTEFSRDVGAGQDQGQDNREKIEKELILKIKKNPSQYISIDDFL